MNFGIFASNRSLHLKFNYVNIWCVNFLFDDCECSWKLSILHEKCMSAKLCYFRWGNFEYFHHFLKQWHGSIPKIFVLFMAVAKYINHKNVYESDKSVWHRMWKKVHENLFTLQIDKKSCNREPSFVNMTLGGRPYLS